MLSQMRLTRDKIGKKSHSENPNQPDKNRLIGLLRSKL